MAVSGGFGAILDRIAGRRPDPGPKVRAGFGAALLFVAPLPLAVRAPFQEAQTMLFSTLALAMLLGAAWLTRHGVIAHKTYDLRSAARRPAIPRKIFAAVATGLGLGLATWPVTAPANAAIYAVAGLALHLVAFGPDPLRDKRPEGAARPETERALRSLAEAEAQLTAMSEVAAALADRDLSLEVARFQSTARRMFRRVEEDPRDLPAARRYLGVYLQGARDATDRYATLVAHGPNPQARADYLGLLADLEQSFAAKAERLIENDRTDLRIEIDVLRDRLAQEAVSAEEAGRGGTRDRSRG
ncbi:5-bromo-4-chloroindolyl phosphate hydrolysis family protein [Halodurantibacterium flavum]|uniref:5-bromo-4-chloroindolyl phosphate hydrolysis family protein n=1 Tax=Halodurantibacterium flavum TaxID=1382802 RepID=A0ABW4S8Y8_9RHOB